MYSLEAIKASLISASEPYFPEPGQHWLRQALQAIAGSDRIGEDLGLFMAMAKRKLGNVRLETAGAIDTRFSPLDIRRWSTADAGRSILLLSAVERDPDQAAAIITSCYRMGDESEHIAIVRGLIFFAPGDYLTGLALEAGRTNNLELLAALALDNPYPGCFYTEPAFNQMVLKCLFLGLAIERIEAVEQRANPELARMCENYVVEREAAGRSVPVDIWLAIGPYASETGRRRMIEYLDHDEAGHRYYCALALSQRLSRDPSLAAILRQRLQTEQDPNVGKLLQQSLQAALH